MNKVHVFSVLVLVTGLLFSCSSTDDLKLPEPSWQEESSSSSLPAGTGFCWFPDGTCTPSPISVEACVLLDGLPVQSCGGSSSSFATQSSSSIEMGNSSSSSNEVLASSSSLPLGSGFCRFSDGICSSSPVSLETCSAFEGTLDQSCAPSSSSVASTSSSSVAPSSSSLPEGTVLCGFSDGTCMPSPVSLEACVLLGGSSVQSCSVGSSSSAVPSSASEELSSSSSPAGIGLCAGFVDGTEREHYGKEKKQFCDERDGTKYVYVAIGTQTWMAENLNYEVEDSRCHGDNSSNCTTYGRLYNWNAAITICPNGWRLPSREEWEALSSYVQSTSGCSSSSCDAIKLKVTSGWSSGNGTDEYGFSALPGGDQSFGAGFAGRGGYGFWWSFTENESNGYAYLRVMTFLSENAFSESRDKRGLFSVRCLKYIGD